MFTTVKEMIKWHTTIPAADAVQLWTLERAAIAQKKSTLRPRMPPRKVETPSEHGAQKSVSYTKQL